MLIVALNPLKIEAQPVEQENQTKEVYVPYEPDNIKQFNKLQKGNVFSLPNSLFSLYKIYVIPMKPGKMIARIVPPGNHKVSNPFFSDGVLI